MRALRPCHTTSQTITLHSLLHLHIAPIRILLLCDHHLLLPLRTTRPELPVQLRISITVPLYSPCSLTFAPSALQARTTSAPTTTNHHAVAEASTAGTKNIHPPAVKLPLITSNELPISSSNTTRPPLVPAMASTMAPSRAHLAT
jgi:hypothetical protein